MPDFAFVSGARVFVQQGGDEPRELQSPFADSVASREASIQRRNEWKTQGRGARFMMGLGGMPEDIAQSKFEAPAVHYAGVSRGRHAGEVVYALSTGAVSGVFAFSGGEEERIVHGNMWAISEPACEPEGERIACVVNGKHGQSHIGLLRQGHGVQQVTEGEATHNAPSWIPGAQALVFQARAFGYDRQGRVVDLAPSTIQRLDLVEGTLSPLVEDPDAHCTSPRMTPDGALYYLKRPVERGRSVPLGRVLLDALLFPVRLLAALLHYLNVFSLTYSGKPLVTSQSARAKQADVRRAARLGNLASAAANARDEEDWQPPEQWELVRRDTSGTEQRLARHVLCFDVFPDGGIVWSNGTSITYRANNGQEMALGKFEAVSAVLAIGAGGKVNRN